MAAPITVDEFKIYFARDFVFGATVQMVMDSDISKAIGEASGVFNPGIWADVDSQKVAFEYLSAHFLVRCLQMSGGVANGKQGLNSTGTSPIQSKSVGPVSVSYGISQKLLDNPAMSGFLTTQYGQMYLQLITPLLVGNVTVVGGDTLP